MANHHDLANFIWQIAEQRSIVARMASEAAKLDALRLAAEQTMALLKEHRAALIAATVTTQITAPSNPLLLEPQESLC